MIRVRLPSSDVFTKAHMIRDDCKAWRAMLSHTKRSWRTLLFGAFGMAISHVYCCSCEQWDHVDWWEHYLIRVPWWCSSSWLCLIFPYCKGDKHWSKASRGLYNWGPGIPYKDQGHPHCKNSLQCPIAYSFQIPIGYPPSISSVPLPFSVTVNHPAPNLYHFFFGYLKDEDLDFEFIQRLTWGHCSQDYHQPIVVWPPVPILCISSAVATLNSQESQHPGGN